MEWESTVFYFSVFLPSGPVTTATATAGGAAATTAASSGEDPMAFNPGWLAAFCDSRKQKEQDLKTALSSRMEANLSKVVHDNENGVEEKEWEDN